MAYPLDLVSTQVLLQDDQSLLLNKGSEKTNQRAHVEIDESDDKWTVVRRRPSTRKIKSSLLSKPKYVKYGG